MALQLGFEKVICCSYGDSWLPESQKKWVSGGFTAAIVKDGLSFPDHPPTFAKRRYRIPVIPNLGIDLTRRVEVLRGTRLTSDRKKSC